MNSTTQIAYEAVIPGVLQAMERVHGAMAKHDFDRNLSHLIMLQVSQINGCAYCVDMHTREAREDGETNERLDRVIVWRHVDCFSEAEKAAFEWSEHLTLPDQGTNYGPMREKLRRHFTDEQIGVLTSTIAMINLWNRIQISRH